jgi:methylglutaconyl-CoA hydratase
MIDSFFLPIQPHPSPSPPHPHPQKVTVEPLSGPHEGVSLLSLARPAARNALGRQLVRELAEAVDTLRQERTTRCVVLRSGVPGCFSAGADLKERALMTQAEAAEFVSTLRRLMGAVAALPMPTVAVIEGHALGGGAELALACDLRVAARGATLAFPEARLGIIPGAGGTQRLPRLVGLGAAKELVFTARRVGGAEAAAMRLVDHCVEDGRAMERALEIAADIAQVGGCFSGRLGQQRQWQQQQIVASCIKRPHLYTPPLTHDAHTTRTLSSAPPCLCAWPRPPSTAALRSTSTAAWRWRRRATRS